MKRRRIWTTTDDVRITPVVSIAELERVRHLRVNFVFPLRIAGRSPRALVRFDADIDRVLHDAQLHRRLHQTHLSEDGPGILDAETRCGLGPFGRKALLVLVFTTFTFAVERA